MNMRTVAILLIAVVVSVPPSVSAQTDSTDLQAVVQVMRISPTPGKRSYRWGTAFHVGDGVFYTAAHIVTNVSLPDSLRIYTNLIVLVPEWVDGNNLRSALGPAAVECMDKRWVDAQKPRPYDLARFRLPSVPQLPALKFRSEGPREGESVSIVGFPYASNAWPPKRYIATGKIEAIYTSSMTMDIHIESGLTLRGSSGSPVLDAAGRVLGIIYGGFIDDSDTKVAVILDAIRSGCPWK